MGKLWRRVSWGLWGAAILSWGCGGSEPSTAPEGSGPIESGAGSAGAGSSGGPSGMAGEEREGSQEPPAEASADELVYAPCAVEERVGRFAVHSLAQGEGQSGSTQLSGFVRDGVRPADVDRVLLEEGPCQLVTGPDLLCDPRCAFDEVCTPEGDCIAEPTSQDVGGVLITGTTTEFRLVPNTANNYLPEPGVTVDYQPYRGGAELLLGADGADVSPFQLRGRGVTALQLDAGDYRVAMDEPLSLGWQAPPSADGAVRIHVELDIAHHGGVDAQVVCDVPDTGAFEVPAALISGLLQRGVAGFPAVTLARRTVDSVVVDGVGCVEFVVDSEISREVTIPGLLSCGSDDDCPAGQLCMAENLTCG